MQLASKAKSSLYMQNFYFMATTCIYFMNRVDKTRGVYKFLRINLVFGTSTVPTNITSLMTIITQKQTRNKGEINTDKSSLKRNIVS